MQLEITSVYPGILSLELSLCLDGGLTWYGFRAVYAVILVAIQL